MNEGPFSLQGRGTWTSSQLPVGGISQSSSRARKPWETWRFKVLALSTELISRMQKIKAEWVETNLVFRGEKHPGFLLRAEEFLKMLFWP